MLNTTEFSLSYLSFAKLTVCLKDGGVVRHNCASSHNQNKVSNNLKTRQQADKTEN